MSTGRTVKDKLPAAYHIETAEAERFNRYRLTLYHGDEILGTGTHFTGGNHIKPWIELQPQTVFSPENREHQELFDAFTHVLEPGGYLMVHYLQDSETAEALTADVPPPATALGFLMWTSGARWFKDWYFTEGWMEGDQKLQGNLPMNDEVRQEREAEWREKLQRFVDTDSTFRKCQKRAERILEML